MAKHPILIIIPHGGYAVPEEFSGLVGLSDFDLFMQADTCANDLFRFDEFVAAKIDTSVSRLFADLDRSYKDLSRRYADGVIKTRTLFERPVFSEDIFPDEIAVTNILKRYYFPFHETVEKIIGTGEIRLIIECHTVLPVGPPVSHDRGKPRPIVTVENSCLIDGVKRQTCGGDEALCLLESLNSAFADEERSVAASSLTTAPPTALIIGKYGTGDIPFVRLSISKALFINDTYFSHDYLRVDDLRIRELSDRIWEGIDAFYKKI